MNRYLFSYDPSMKKNFLSFEDINKKFPILPEWKWFFENDNLVYINKQLAETLFANTDYSENYLLQIAEKNRKEMGLDKLNYERFLMGVKYCDTWKRNEALQIFQEIKIFFPENIFVLTEIGDLFCDSEDYVNASKIYDTLLQLDPNNFNALHKLWMIRYSGAAYDEALHYYLKIQEYYPEFHDIKVYLWYAYSQLWDYSKAIESLEIAKIKCTENLETQWSILEGIGDSYFWMWEYTESEKYFLQSFNIFPENKGILMKIAQANIKIWNYTRAIDYINLNVQNYGSSFDAIYNLWICYYMYWDFIQAQEYFDLLLKIDPEDIDVISCKTYCILTLDWRQEAISYVNSLLNQYPQKQDLYDIMQDISNS